jgi:hypothetical protein
MTAMLALARKGITEITALQTAALAEWDLGLSWTALLPWHYKSQV